MMMHEFHNSINFTFSVPASMDLSAFTANGALHAYNIIIVKP